MRKCRVLPLILALLAPQAASAWQGNFDIPRLCEDAGMQGVWDLAPIGGAEREFPARELESGSPDEVAEAVAHYCAIRNNPECAQVAPWLILSSPRTEVRVAAHELQLRLAEKFLEARGITGSSVESELWKAVWRKPVYSRAAVAQVRATLAEAARFADFKGKFDEVRTFAPFICMTYWDWGCISALKDALTLGQVGRLRSTAMITMMPAIERVFTDPAHLRGAPLAALILQKKYLDAGQGRIPQGDLLSDLVYAYRATGNSYEKAVDLAFDFLAFYGTRGASMDPAAELANSENYPVMLAAYVISSATGVLDAVTLEREHPYSYPRSIRTRCSYGAPYHFWEAAALARELVRRGHGAGSAFLAAHLTGVGYEALANTTTRTNWGPLTLEPDDYVNDGIRADIVFDDAGAHFGAEFGAGRWPDPIDLDARHVLLYQRARWESKLSPQDARKLYEDSFIHYALHWWNIFVPNAGLSAWKP